MDESRKAFEQYAADRLGLTLEMISDARNGDRYKHSFDRASIMQPLNGWWILWQASRAAIEINWPPHGIDASGGTYHRRDDMRKELSSAGIKVKE